MAPDDKLPLEIGYMTFHMSDIEYSISHILCALGITENRFDWMAETGLQNKVKRVERILMSEEHEFSSEVRDLLNRLVGAYKRRNSLVHGTIMFGIDTPTELLVHHYQKKGKKVTHSHETFSLNDVRRMNKDLIEIRDRSNQIHMKLRGVIPQKRLRKLNKINVSKSD